MDTKRIHAGGASPKRLGVKGDRTVLKTARKLAATIGADFFNAIARHLAQALEADAVVIGEFLGGQVERVRTVGAYLDGEAGAMEYELAGSAAAEVFLGRSTVCRADAQTRFPSDRLVAATSAQAFAATPLLNERAEAAGFMMALYRRPLTQPKAAKDLLDIFAERAAAELARKQEEDLLRECEQRHRAFISNSADALWRIELEQTVPVDLPSEEQLERIYRFGYLAECNDASARLLGREFAAQVIGSRLPDILPADDSAREATLKAIRAGHRFSTVEISSPDPSGGRRHFLRSQWGIVEDGKLERIWGSTRDITDLKRSERALDASEQRMSDLLESMHLVTVLVDPQGAVEFCNNYLYRLTGRRETDTVGQNWLDVIAVPDERSRVRAAVASADLNSYVPLHFESTLAAGDGRRYQFEWDRAMLRDEDGKLAMWAILGRDLTQYRALEAQFRQSQKLATLGRVAGGVAHDFNNLLTVILGYSAALLEIAKPADPCYMGLTEIRKAASKGAELTHRLLSFGRRQALRPGLLNLNTLIADAEHMLRRLIGSDIILSTNLEPTLGVTNVDPGYFHQVLMNLAVNARDAMPHGGHLIITTANLDINADSTFSTLCPLGHYVALTVTDTGCGMSEEVQSHLFEPFFTTKEKGKGTGLGLSTVYGIVQQSGGRIAVDTKVGHGTTVRILLPRLEGSAAVADTNTPSVKAGGSETILLVEDGEDVRTLTSSVLTGLGYTVREADGPERALALAQDGQRIDLLLTDIVMPHTQGFELASMIRKYQKNIKVLFMSGHVDADQLAGKESDPDFAYLPKPYTPDELAAKIRQILDAAAQPQRPE